MHTCTGLPESDQEVGAIRDEQHQQEKAGPTTYAARAAPSTTG